MKKRFLIGLAILASVFALILTVLWFLPPRMGVVSRANFDRIEKGMTYRDVCKLLGNQFGLDDLPELPLPLGAPKGDVKLAMGWLADDGSSAFITFNNGQVSETNWHESPEGAFQRLRRWVGLGNVAVAPPPSYAAPPPLPASPYQAPISPNPISSGPAGSNDRDDR